MLRMRVLAAAMAKFMRSAPWVMLPASTTSRKSLRSVRSKRIDTVGAFVFCEGRLRWIPIVSSGGAAPDSANTKAADHDPGLSDRQPQLRRRRDRWRRRRVARDL